MLFDETLIILLRVDITFTRKERAALERSCEEWYRFTRGAIFFHPLFDLYKQDLDAPMQDDLVLRVSPEFWRIAATPIIACGLYQPETIAGKKDYRATIYLVPQRLRMPGAFEETMTHELGHFLGLDHTEGRSVMNAGSAGVTRLTEIDAKEFCRAFECGIEELDFVN